MRQYDKDSIKKIKKDKYIELSSNTLPNINQFDERNQIHIQNVISIMNILSELIKTSGSTHDYTKLSEPLRTLYYINMYNAIREEKNFEESEWYNIHVDNERYHIKDRNKKVKSDIDLIDILEHICNAVCSGREKGQSEDISVTDIDSKILSKAFQNTVKLINTIVVYDDESEQDADTDVESDD